MTVVVTREMKRKEVVRELAMREKYYPRKVEAQEMGPVEMDTRIAVMRAIVSDYSASTLDNETRRDLKHAVYMAMIADGVKNGERWRKLEALVERL